MKDSSVWPYIAFFILLPFLIYGGFKINRWFNWEFQYRANVEATVLELVKPEALK